MHSVGLVWAAWQYPYTKSWGASAGDQWKRERPMAQDENECRRGLCGCQQQKFKKNDFPENSGRRVKSVCRTTLRDVSYVPNARTAISWTRRCNWACGTRNRETVGR